MPYDTAFLSGHVVEHYQVVLLDAAQRSVEQMHAKLMKLCAQQIPGDTHRNLQIYPEFSGRTFKHVLVPVWLLTYNYGSKPYQVIVNGYTGRDRRPVSAQLLEDRAARAAGGAGDARLHLAQFSIARRAANSQLPIPNSQVRDWALVVGGWELTLFLLRMRR